MFDHVFFIRDGSSELIAGFSARHQVVQRTGDTQLAKKFRSAAAASMWAARHAGCGYGFDAPYQVEPA